MTIVGIDGVVSFRFYRPNASQVMLAGDFNNWRSDTPMKPAGDGWWTMDLRLPEGDYRFRYQADGQWYPDYASHGVELDNQGWTSLLVVQNGGRKK